MSIITLQEDIDFLKKYTDTMILEAADASGKIVVAPGIQARVLTSGFSGDGQSFGWINRELIASGERREHINAFGGEDRYWLGPEGGQFSIFFKPGDPMDMEHWQTPEPFDWGGWDTVEQANDRAAFRKLFEVANSSGTVFSAEAERTVQAVGARQAARELGVEVDGLNCVAFHTTNFLTNTGTNTWSKAGGMLSIWILGMLNASPGTVALLPFHTGDEAELGPIINDDYFGKAPDDRLKVLDGIALFKCDSKHRSKVGLAPRRSKALLGSYAADRNSLSVVLCTQPADELDYVNSMWEIQEKPFRGDVLNSYNDGPAPGGGAQLGSFYELETSSPAVEAAPGETAGHTHRTYHFEGEKGKLNNLTEKLFGVSLQQIEAAF